MARKKTDFQSFDWKKGKGIPLSAAYPPARKESKVEYEARLKRIERAASGSMTDPNNVDGVKQKVLSINYKSPFSGWEYDGVPM